MLLALHSALPVESHGALLLGAWHPLTLGAVLMGALAAVAEGQRGASAMVLAVGLAGLPVGFRLFLVRTQIHIAGAGCAELPGVEQIARETWSPLFGQDPGALREVLCRARFLLSA